MKRTVKKEEKTPITFIILLIALFLLAQTLFSVVKEFSYTGAPTTQTATISLTVNPINVTAAAETNVSGGLGGKPGRAGDLTFTTIPQFFALELEEGKEHQETLRIINTGDITSTFFFTVNKNFITFSKDSLTLRPGEEAATTLTIEPLKRGIFTAVIKVKTEFASKQVPITIDVYSPGAAFDIILNIPQQFKTVKPGAELFSTITLSDLDGGFVDVNFVIMDAASNILHQEREILQVKNTITIDKTISVPAFLLPGTYAYGVIVQYQGETKTKTQLITLKEAHAKKQPTLEQPQQQPKKSLVVTIVLIFFIVVHYLIIRRRRRLDL